MLVLYSVEITRFSSLLWRCLRIVSFCTLLKLQGSQAGVISCKEGQEFCTLLKLQGSQALGVHHIPTAEFCTLLKLQGSQAMA